MNRVRLTGTPIDGTHPPKWNFACDACGFIAEAMPRDTAMHACQRVPAGKVLGLKILDCQHNQGPTGEMHRLPGCGNPETAIFKCAIFTQCVPLTNLECAELKRCQSCDQFAEPGKMVEP